jgi:hypothetical protein
MVQNDPVAAVDYITPLRGKLSKFNSFVDTIAEVWNFIRQRLHQLSCSKDLYIRQGSVGRPAGCVVSKVFIYTIPDVSDARLTDTHL